MGRKTVMVAIGCAMIFFFMADLGNAVKKEHEVPPLIRGTRVGPEAKLLPGVELPSVRSQKLLPCTLAAWHFDGGETPWIAGWVPYGFHCDTYKYYDGTQAWWNGDPVIGGYQNMWKERLETDTLTVGGGGDVTLSFMHWMRCEIPEWDGGNVWMSVNGAAFQIIFPDSDQYDTTLARAWEAHGDSAMPAFARKDTMFRYAEFNESPGAGASVVFRFEFATDWAFNTADDSTLFGWVIDSILVTSGASTLWESNCDGSEDTYYAYAAEPPSAFSKSDYDSPPSPDSSWRAEDYVELANCALTSPWVYIPDYCTDIMDSVRKVELQWRCNEYVPGASVGGYLQDYYSVEVVGKKRTGGWLPFPEGQDTVHLAYYWYEMTHDYDHWFDHACPFPPSTPDTCSCPPFWRLMDRDSIYNGYLNLDQAVGDTIRVRICWQTDSILQASALRCQSDGYLSGTYWDDVVITGGPGFAQDAAEAWTNEGNRPIYHGVMVGKTYSLQSTVKNEGFRPITETITNRFSIQVIDTVPDPDDTTFYDLGSCAMSYKNDTLFPGEMASCNISWTPDTTHLSPYADQLFIYVDWGTDMNSENDTLEPCRGPYYVYVFPEDTVLLGYNVSRSFYGVFADSGGGYAVRFDPHSVGQFHLYGMRLMGAYGGHYKINIFGQGINDSTPGDTIAVSDELQSLPHDSGWTYVRLDTFGIALDTLYEDLRKMPGDKDFWIFIEETRKTDTCGIATDETTIDGEHSYRKADADTFFNNYSPQDMFIQAYIANALPCGDCNGDGKVTFADALALKNWYYQTPPGSPPCQGQGDVNLDGKTTFGDALYIKNWYYQTPPGSPPPCEPPLKGSDERATVGFSSPRTESGVVEIPVCAQFGVPSEGVGLEVAYDHRALKPLMPELTSRTEGLDLCCNPDMKKGRLLMGVLALTTNELIQPGDGAVVMLRFKSVGSEVDLSSLRIEEAIVVDEQAREMKTTVLGYPFGPALPKVFSLSQNYPNPLVSGTQISYALPKNVKVKVEVYNLLGEKVKTLVNREEKAGYKTVRWDGTNANGNIVAPGVYFYRIAANGFTATKKMIVVQ